MSNGPIYPYHDTEEGQLEALRRIFTAWHITRGAFQGYKALWKSETGLQIREVHGLSIADLHKRLETIEAARADSEG